MHKGGDFFTKNGPIWLKSGATNEGSSTIQEIEQDILFLTTVWSLWKARNKLIFDGQRPPAVITARLAIARAKEFQSVRHRDKIQPTNPTSRTSNWMPPPTDFVKLNTDGSVIGDNAATGGLLRDAQGHWIAGFLMNIGLSTVHDSELWGLRQGLFLALNLDFKQIIVESDSLEVIKALRSPLHQNYPAPALLIDCQGLLQKFKTATIHHSPRETNSAADFLAKSGHHLRHGVTSYQSPPWEILSILCKEALGHVP